MAKKQTKKAEVEVSQVEETVIIEQPVVKTPKVEVKPKPKKDTWEIKDRVYFLKRNKKSLTFSMKSSGIYYFDEEKGYERELKYCENQRTVFVDEMQGDQRLAHIIFRNGGLHVPREKVTLQKLLSLYHPMRDKLFYEFKPQVNAANELDKLEIEADAMIVAKSLDIDKLEAVMRVELGSKVSQMSSKELKRDALLFAKNNPALFLELVEDENVELRNIGIKAVEAGILRLSQDQRTFFWASNDRKIMTVPFDEHPYSALAVWFKTDEGMEIFKSIEKRLNM
jgi:hypothetical protein